MSDRAILRADGTVEVINDTIDWAKQFSNIGRIVARTAVDGAEASTVFLGLDHSFGAGPPLWFETMVFGGPLDGEMSRYETKADAKAGHRLMVARVTNGTAGEGNG